MGELCLPAKWEVVIFDWDGLFVQSSDPPWRSPGIIARIRNHPLPVSVFSKGDSESEM